MNPDVCPSCGYSLPAAVRASGGPVRCPRCGDPVPGEDAPTITQAPEPGGDSTRPAPADPATVDYEPARTAPRPTLPAVPGYQLLEVIGRGGMGVVYKAYQLSPRRIVALKMILGGGGRPERFRAEVAAVARLQHPNVVQIHEVGELGGRPFFSMEYVPGGSLAAHLRSGPLPTPAAAELVATLARAVQHAHDRGIVHRDLKPGNILLSGVGSQETGVGKTTGDESASELTSAPRHLIPVPKIADFGLAKHLEGSADGAGPMTQSGAILGTPGYMAPEQAKGKVKEVGPATDVWALGAILYECLTGRPPFHEDSHLDTMMKVISEDPEPPRKLRPAVPRDLEVICLKCLRKAPRERYKSAGELADDLARFLEGEPIKARPRTVRERLAGWARRRRELLFMAAGAALIVGLAAVLVEWGPRKNLPPVEFRPLETASSLPEDLRLVPPDAYEFATVRVADLWENPATRELLDHLSRRNDRDPGPTLDAIGKEVERVTSVHPADVERATFVWPRAGGGRAALLVIATRGPYSHDRLRDTLLKRGQHTPEQMGPNRHRVYTPLNADGGMSYLPFSDAVLVMGHPDLVGECARQPDRGTGPLTPLLERAAGRHTLVLGTHPAGEAGKRQLLASLRLGPDPATVAPLRTLGVAIDIGRPEGPAGPLSVDFAGWATFGDADAAGAARPHMPRLMAGVREYLLGGQNFVPPEFLASFLAPVTGAAWQQEGETLRAEARVTTDVPAVVVQLDEMTGRRRAELNMSQIATAMHQYHAKHGRFPPAVVADAGGTPLYSWRVLLLPHLGAENLYRRFHLNRAWDHPSNKPLLDEMPRVFAADPAARHDTPYQVLTGPGGLFDSPDGRAVGEIPDGAENTILFVEAPKAVPWSAPADVPFVADRPPELTAPGRPGFLVVTADDKWPSLLGNATPPARLRALFTRAGGEKLPK